MKSWIVVASLAGILSGCAEQAPRPAVSLAGVQAEAATRAVERARGSTDAQRQPVSTRISQVTRECERDRFADRTVCAVSLRLATGTGGAGAGGTMMTTDGGRRWDIVMTAVPFTYRLRVDGNPTIEGRCSGPMGACTISGAQAATLTRQLRAGTTLAAEVVGRRSFINADVPLAGLREALDQPIR